MKENLDMLPSHRRRRWSRGSFANYVQQVVEQRDAAGDSRVRYWLLDEIGLDNGGCHYQFSTHEDRLIAERLRFSNPAHLQGVRPE
jgi:hypothetical protein